MTIGPAPMIRMLLMSVRFGIPSSLLLHQRGEAVKQVPDVARSRARLRMALEAERRAVGACEALQAAVKEGHMRRAKRRGHAGRMDRTALVLAGDHDLPRVEVLHRVIGAV